MGNALKGWLGVKTLISPSEPWVVNGGSYTPLVGVHADALVGLCGQQGVLGNWPVIGAAARKWRSITPCFHNNGTNEKKIERRLGALSDLIITSVPFSFFSIILLFL